MTTFRSIRHTIILFILLGLVFSSLPSLSKAEIPMGGGGYESLKIIYTISGKHQYGKEVFIQKGTKTYRKTRITTKFNLREYEEHILEVDDGEYFYRINLIDKTGLKLPSINKLKKEMIENNPHLFAKGKATPLSVRPEKGKLNRTESVLGKTCEIYLHNSHLIYIWDEIILKETWDLSGIIAKTAKILNLNEPVSDTIFSVPHGIVFQDKTRF